MPRSAHKNAALKVLSYLSRIPVEKRRGVYTDNLSVVLDRGKYMLNTASVTYSFEDRYTSFSRALHHIKGAIPGMNKALVLGLGLGSVPYMLRKIHAFRGSVTCVEIDPIVIELAEKYYPDPKEFDQMQIICADAMVWADTCSEYYDLIAVDVFIDNAVPEALASVDFMENLKRLLSNNGILLFSRLSSRKHLETALWKSLRTTFPEAEEIDTGGNVILCFRK